MLNENELISILDIKGKLPEEVRPLIKAYCEIKNVLISREAYPKLIFEITDADIKYSACTNEELTFKLNIIYKLIFLRYGNYRNTETSAKI